MKIHINAPTIKIFIIFLVLVVVTIAWQDARAFATCETTGPGNWSDDAIWNCVDIPAPGDDVIINHLVTLDIPAEVNNLTIFEDAGQSLTGDLTTDEDLTILGDFAVYPAAFFDASFSTITFAGTNITQTISGDPDFNNLTIANSGDKNWVILDGITEIWEDLTIHPGSRFSYTGDSIEVGNVFTNNGIIRITKAVNLSAEFPSSASTGYHGLDLVSTSDLGDVTVTIRHLGPGQSCLTNATTNYASRCFTVDPPLPANTTVTLWVHDSERNGIDPAALTPYEFANPAWTVLDSITRGSNGSFYSAEGDTNAGGTGDFLLGSGTAPTAINLLALTASSGGRNGQTAAVGLAVILLAALGVSIWRRQQA